MRILLFVLFAIALSACVDEDFEPLEPVPQDIFDPTLKDLFEINEVEYLNRGGGSKVVRVNYSVFTLRIPPEQRAIATRMIATTEGTTVTTAPITASRFTDFRVRRPGDRVCYEMAVQTTEGTVSRPTTFCVVIP